MKYTGAGDLDRHMPTMINLTPKSFLAAYQEEGLEENFLANSMRLTTSVDQFWTDLGIIGGAEDFNKQSKPYGWLVN
jgi:hypothetical protein